MLRDAARFLGAAAEVFDRVVDGFQHAMHVCDSGTWFGVAGAAYRIRVRETREAVRIGGSSFREAAAALAHLADQLESAQRRARTAHAAAESAAGTMALANTALLGVLAQRDPDTQEQIRLQRNVHDARDDLTAAHGAGRSAYQEAVDAAQAAAAALDQVSSNAKAPPAPPDPDMEPTETPSQFLRRQFSDVAIDTVNPFPDWLSRWKEGRITGDWITGLVLGGTEGISQGYAKEAQTNRPGYWAKMPTAVSGHERTLPSGRKIPRGAVLPA